MAKLSLINAAVLAMWVVSASAQSTGPSAPATPNSGAGVQGMPGNKSGPTVRPNTPGNPTAGQSGTTTQDASKVPGAPGGKSGPTAKPDSQK
jgi:hypothetical protein